MTESDFYADLPGDTAAVLALKRQGRALEEMRWAFEANGQTKPLPADPTAGMGTVQKLAYAQAEGDALLAEANKLPPDQRNRLTIPKVLIAGQPEPLPVPTDLSPREAAAAKREQLIDNPRFRQQYFDVYDPGHEAARAEMAELNRVIAGVPQ
jgi:hypothetical protein